MKKSIFMTVLGLSLFLVACSEKKDQPATDTTTTAPAEDTPPVAEPSAAVSNAISLTGDDKMKYSQTEFTVKSGEPVELTMKNIGTLPAASMSHDVVVLKPGSDVTAFGQEVSKIQGDIEKLPENLKSQIVAKTKVLGPGEEDKISFTLPSPGEYPFLCSFPGHFGAMNGKITAQ
ncbi:MULTISPECIES: plastocyanin/azurin family copper-binding protein [Amniculibacterium]|uniref:plastocyanin/azurin family copper-binding protein n=1 Tax=Amniculibacterium TaxID=2715289 RepID=UPI000F59310D|nr:MULTISPECIES: plastocyanin/azurin family copper-binding protein [Amniculibacterium]